MTAVTDSAGTVLERYAYEAYGKTTVLEPNQFDMDGKRVAKLDQTPIQPYGFTGRRMDYEEGSSLYFYRNRYYDPEAGRFISRDPRGMWGDAGQRGNAQNYCGNNPINRVDPFGDSPPLWWQRSCSSLVPKRL
ncbi:MAG: RHS repeat-associated core domain-containing protein [Planctomycetes bacterium]|nr:RHS repeat-associated core domain-containing protein [Planctomycetota bacterium]